MPVHRRVAHGMVQPGRRLHDDTGVTAGRSASATSSTAGRQRPSPAAAQLDAGPDRRRRPDRRGEVVAPPLAGQQLQVRPRPSAGADRLGGEQGCRAGRGDGSAARPPRVAHRPRRRHDPVASASSASLQLASSVWPTPSSTTLRGGVAAQPPNPSRSSASREAGQTKRASIQPTRPRVPRGPRPPHRPCSCWPAGTARRGRSARRAAPGARPPRDQRLTRLPGTMSSRPSGQRTQALWPPS